MYVKARATDFVIYPYTEGMCKSLEALLTSYEEIMPNAKLREMSKKEFYRFDDRRHKLHVPKCVGFKVIEHHLGNSNINCQMVNGSDELIIPKQAHRLTLADGIGPKDEIQKEAIDFVLGRGEHENLANRSQKLIELATGYGKTFVTIAASCALQQRTIVVCPIGSVSKQWVDAFHKFTNVPRKRIKLIEGVKNFMYEGLKRKINHDVWIISLTTAKILAEENPGVFSDIMHNFGPGLFVRDECHMHIKAIIQLDTNVSCARNLYLSATAKRDSSFEDKVFQKVFEKMPRYGINTHYLNPFLNIVAIYHELAFPEKLEKKMYTFKKFFRRDGYAATFLKHKRKEYEALLFRVTDPLFKIMQPDRKVSIFLGQIEEIDEICELLQKRHPNMVIKPYHSKMTNKKEKEESLGAGVIVTTAGSLGTGSDVKGLKYQLDFYPTGGDGKTIQRAGRTREIDGEEVYYVLIYNTAIAYFRRACESHKDLFANRIKSWTEKYY